MKCLPEPFLVGGLWFTSQSCFPLKSTVPACNSTIHHSRVHTIPGSNASFQNVIHPHAVPRFTRLLTNGLDSMISNVPPTLTFILP